MSRTHLSRRDLLERCAAFGALLVPALDVESVAAFWSQADALKPTPPNALGPFYKKRAPDARMDLPSGRVLRRITPQPLPSSAEGFTADGRFVYATAKGPDLTVWMMPGAGPRPSEPSPGR